MFETLEAFFLAAQLNLSLSTNATGITCFNEPNNIRNFEIIRNILKQMTSADRIVNWQEVTKYVWDSTTTTVLTVHCTVPDTGTTSSKKSTGRSNRCLIWPNYKCYTPRRMFVAQRLGGFGFHVDIDMEFIEVDSLYSISQIRVKSNTSSQNSIYSFSNDTLSMMAAVVSSSESIIDIQENKLWIN